MNKSELIESVADIADLSKAEAEAAVNAFISSVSEELKTGGSVALIGFGSFEVKQRSERSGRNPQTGEPITIAAAQVPSFKAGKALKEAVN
jgi:DNA-binding protein HU-beta